MVKNFLADKPYLFWSVKNKSELSVEAILEAVFNYGDWQDFLKAERILGRKKVKQIFNKLKNRRRTNLRAKTVNFFELYFSKYAR